MRGELQRSTKKRSRRRLTPCALKCEVYMEDEWNEYVMPSSPELVLKTIARLAERDKRYGNTFQERRLT